MNRYDVMFIFACISAVTIPSIAISLSFPWYMLIASFTVTFFLLTGIITTIVEELTNIFSVMWGMHTVIQDIHREEKNLLKFMAVISAVFLTVQLLYHLLL